MSHASVISMRGGIEAGVGTKGFDGRGHEGQDFTDAGDTRAMEDGSYKFCPRAEVDSWAAVNIFPEIAGCSAVW